MSRRFIYSKTKSSFKTKLDAGEISDNSIGFIGDSNEIWTHSNYYLAIPKGGSINLLVKYSEDGDIEWGTLEEVLKETLCYGVQFDSEIADPHLTRIGNLEYHRTLPILSLLAGCIALADKIIYWLHPDDWRWKKEPTILNEIVLLLGDLIKVRAETFSTLQYEKLWIKIDDIPCQIDSIETTNKLATLVVNDEIKAYITKSGSHSIEYGAVVNGYDGTVRVYCPKFYIKSETVGTVSKVWITTEYIDDSWECLPEILIDAYRCTLLNTVPENMGYLSTLPVNSAISVANTNTYCRGGGNRESYDLYLTTDPCRTDLGKPRTSININTFRTYARNANSYLLNYLEYKNIFYWLWVIEYANFKSLEAYNENLTEEGYHLGGLGPSLIINAYNSYCSTAIIPCGYANNLGNNTGKINITIESFNTLETTINKLQRESIKYRCFESYIGDISTNVDGILIDANISNKNPVYVCNRPAYYSDIINNAYYKIGNITSVQGYIKSFNLGNHAYTLPKNLTDSADKYICSLNLPRSNNSDLRTLFVGSVVNDASSNNIIKFNWGFKGIYTNLTIGFRTVNEISTMQ